VVKAFATDDVESLGDVLEPEFIGRMLKMTFLGPAGAMRTQILTYEQIHMIKKQFGLVYDYITDPLGTLPTSLAELDLECSQFFLIIDNGNFKDSVIVANSVLRILKSSMKFDLKKDQVEKLLNVGMSFFIFVPSILDQPVPQSVYEKIRMFLLRLYKLLGPPAQCKFVYSLCAMPNGSMINCFKKLLSKLVKYRLAQATAPIFALNMDIVQNVGTRADTFDHVVFNPAQYNEQC